MICSYSAMLTHTLFIILLTYILFLIYNNIYYKYILFLHIQGSQMHLIALSSMVRDGQENTGRKRNEVLEVGKASRVTGHRFAPLQHFFSPMLLQVICCEVNKLQPSYHLHTGSICTKIVRSIVKGLPRLESWCRLWECLTLERNSRSITQCAVTLTLKRKHHIPVLLNPWLKELLCCQDDSLNQQLCLK